MLYALMSGFPPTGTPNMTKCPFSKRKEGSRVVLKLKTLWFQVCSDRTLSVPIEAIATPIIATRTLRGGDILTGAPAIANNHSFGAHANPQGGPRTMSSDSLSPPNRADAAWSKGYWGGSHGFKSGTPGR